MTEASIFPEQARVLEHHALADNQYIIRLHVPNCAAHVLPGNFIHLSCDQNPYALKRPFSVLRCDAAQGWIEVLYKTVGEGTRNLSLARVGDQLHCLGPIGNSFELSDNKTLPLLLGGGVGIPPIVFFAEYLRAHTDITPLVMMGSEIAFPFAVATSQQSLAGVPEQSDAVMQSLHAQDIPSRLCSKQGYKGFFDGYINELAECWLSQLDTQQLASVEIFACGPEPMLSAVAALAKKYQLACQLSLEEHMACAVGGCAGCTVEITDAQGQAQMKRVCVDGPVFDAYSVY